MLPVPALSHCQSHSWALCLPCCLLHLYDSRRATSSHALLILAHVSVDIPRCQMVEAAATTYTPHSAGQKGFIAGFKGGRAVLPDAPSLRGGVEGGARSLDCQPCSVIVSYAHASVSVPRPSWHFDCVPACCAGCFLLHNGETESRIHDKHSQPVRPTCPPALLQHILGIPQGRMQPCGSCTCKLCWMWSGSLGH